MTDCGQDYYSYQLPEQFASCKHIMIIFNNGKGDQIPGAMQTGMTMGYTDKKLYDGTKWINLPSSEPTPVEPSELSEEPSTEPSEEPSTEPSEEPVSEPASEPVSEPASEPASEVSTEPVSTPSAEPSAQQIQPASQSQTSVITPGSDHVSTADQTPLVAVMAAVFGSAAAAAFVLGAKKKRSTK